MKGLFRKKSIDQIQQEIAKGYTDSEHGGLKRSLSFFDLTSLGIAAIIGAGIFATIGKASANGGAAVSLLFIFIAVACIFSALCYAQFASTIPISGSAYTYSYASFGELVAWIIGWALILEYSVGNIVVAISWSGYFTGFINGLGVHFPEYLSTDYGSAKAAFSKATEILATQKTATIPMNFQEGYTAWKNAPEIAGVKIILDVPAFIIVALVSILAYIGIKESKNASNAMVALKIAVVFLVIIVGAMYVKPENWSPFAPNGIDGVLKGISAIFFSYIGFDAISTTAEECKNPQRDLPRAMITAVIVCTVLYVAVTLVLTGVMNAQLLSSSDDPLAAMFKFVKLDFLSGVVAVSAIFAMTSVLLVFQLGQPRIWMAMSRDGLLPKKFSKIHPKYQTPAFATVVAGLFVALPTPFVNVDFVTDLTSIGTLFAFVLVCGGVLVLENTESGKRQIAASRFRVPYLNGKWLLPIMLTLVVFGVYNIDNKFFVKIIDFKFEKLPTYLFLLFSVGTVVITFMKNLSLIPVLGLVVNFYLMSEIGIQNWIGFVIWLLIGLVIYFGYSRKNSKLNTSLPKD